MYYNTVILRLFSLPGYCRTLVTSQEIIGLGGVGHKEEDRVRDNNGAVQKMSEHRKICLERKEKMKVCCKLVC